MKSMRNVKQDDSFHAGARHDGDDDQSDGDGDGDDDDNDDVDDDDDGDGLKLDELFKYSSKMMMLIVM